jgi:hypothetical protein
MPGTSFPLSRTLDSGLAARLYFRTHDSETPSPRASEAQVAFGSHLNLVPSDSSVFIRPFHQI